MKSLYKLFFVVLPFLPINLLSQSLVIIGDEKYDYSLNIEEHWDIYFSASVKNIGPLPINIKLSTTVKKIEEGHSYDVCWDGLCSPPTTKDWISSSSVKLNPGEATPEGFFYAHYYSFYKDGNPTIGEGNILYTFANESNPTDKVEIDAKFKFVEGNSVYEIFGNPELDFSIENRTIRISTNKFENMYIEIFDISGITLLSQSSSNYYQSTLNSFSAGTYLIRISSNGRIISKGKFILN